MTYIYNVPSLNISKFGVNKLNFVEINDITYTVKYIPINEPEEIENFFG